MQSSVERALRSAPRTGVTPACSRQVCVRREGLGHDSELVESQRVGTGRPAPDWGRKRAWVARCLAERKSRCLTI